MKLAEYLRDRYLTIDCFDSTTQFFFGTCKIPLYELLRGGKNEVVRPKECEIFEPENSLYQGFLQIILANKGEHTQASES